MKHFLLFLSLLLCSAVVFGQSVTTTTLVNLDLPSAADTSNFIQALGGAKTLGGLGIVMAVVQALMLIIKSKLVDLGKWNLVVVMVLSTLGSIIYLKVSQNLPWSDVLLHSQTMFAYQVLFHQIYSQFIKPEDPPVLGGNPVN